MSRGKHELISKNLARHFEGKTMPPVVQNALGSLKDWEIGNVLIKGGIKNESTEKKSPGLELIDLNSITLRNHKTHGFSSDMDEITSTSLTERGKLGTGKLTVKQRLAKTMVFTGVPPNYTRERFDRAMEDALAVGQISMPAATALRAWVEEHHGNIEATYRTLLQQAKSKGASNNRTREPGLLADLSYVINAEQTEWPAAIAERGVHNLFRKRGIPVVSGEKCKDEVAICAATALNIQHAVFDTLLANSSRKTVLVPQGYFEPMVVIPYIHGGEMEVISTAKENNYKLTAQALEETIQRLGSQTVNSILLSNPGNPIGSEYTKEELEKIGAVAVKHGLTIVVDEHFAGLDYVRNKRAPSPHTSLASLSVNVDGQQHRLYDHSVTIQGTTKILDFETTRMGLCCSGNKELIAAVKKDLRERRELLNRQEIEILDIIMQSGFSNLEDNQKKLANRRTVLKTVIEKVNKDRPSDPLLQLMGNPEGGFFAVIGMPRKVLEKIGIHNSQDFQTYCALAANVHGRSIDGMGFDQSEMIGMRINYSTNSPEKLEEAINRLSMLGHGIEQGRVPPYDDDLKKGLMAQRAAVARRLGW